MKGRIVFVALGSAWLASAVAWAADPVAVLTEIQVRRGQAHVRAVGETAWSAPRPLQSLRPGDQVRVVGEGRAILVFTGGKMEVVTQNNSPYSVPAQPPEGVSERLRSVLGGVTGFLMGQRREGQYQSLSVRSVRQPPVILAPRDTKVLPGSVTFEWSGSDRSRYRIRLSDTRGAVVWEQSDLPRLPVAYPAGALAPGRYAWELATVDGQHAQRAEFEVLTADEADRMKEEMGALQTAAASAGYTRGTLALLRAGLLFRQGLNADARRELLASIAASPNEPSLHLLLGHVYDRIGLRNLAADQFDEADTLTRQP